MPMNFGGNTQTGTFFQGLPGVLQSMFGNSGAAYGNAANTYSQYYDQARNAQNPFFQMGTSAIPQFQNWLQKMQDPTKFINSTMGQYQESPFAQYQQQQGMRAAQNMGSASGLTGSTPLMQFAQQNAQNISSQDMNQWLQNVLGINSQYGAGLSGQMGMGQHAADILSQLAGGAGEYMGGAAYGQRAGEQADRDAGWAGLIKMFGG